MRIFYLIVLLVLLVGLNVSGCKVPGWLKYTATEIREPVEELHENIHKLEKENE